MPLNFGGRKRSGVFDTVWPSAKTSVLLHIHCETNGRNRSLQQTLSRGMGTGLRGCAQIHCWSDRLFCKACLRGRKRCLCAAGYRVRLLTSRSGVRAAQGAVCGLLESLAQRPNSSLSVKTQAQPWRSLRITMESPRPEPRVRRELRGGWKLRIQAFAFRLSAIPPPESGAPFAAKAGVGQTHTHWRAQVNMKELQTRSGTCQPKQ